MWGLIYEAFRGAKIYFLFEKRNHWHYFIEQQTLLRQKMLANGN